MNDAGLIQELLHRQRHPPIPDLTGRSIVIYGAGGKARSLARRLRGSSRIVAFIDKNARSINPDDLEAPVMTPEQWDAAPLTCDAIALAVHNFATDLAPVRHWAGTRFKTILSMADLMDILPGWEGPHYWAAPRHFLTQHREDLTRMLSRLEEPLSRSVFLAALQERLSGIHDGAAPTLNDQYAPLSLPAIGSALRVIDCGAFNGDSLLKIKARETIEDIAAFEPDPGPQEALLRVCESICPNSTIFKAGVWSRDCALSFNPIGPGSGSFTEFSTPGDHACPAFSLDSLWASGAIPFSPNFIKMDIEGAEIQALEGAREMLSELRPALAISAYHQPADLWSIADWLANQKLGYHFYFRSHGHNGFDLVLYARPDTSLSSR